MFFLNNTKQILQSAMDCKEYGDCEGCKHTTEEGYYGERKDTCFDVIMENSCTSTKAEMIIQMYRLGFDNGITEREKVIQPYESRINEGEFEWICSICNNSVKEGQVYCHTCGTKLTNVIGSEKG